MTLRLPDELVAEGQAFASRLGISMNALMAVALRDYLDGRTTGRLPGVSSPSGRAAGSTSARSQAPSPAPAPASASVVGFKAPKSRADPCPCGALDQRGYPLKWKHCHGKAP